MGADIHSRVEIKWDTDSDWMLVTEALWPNHYFIRSRPVDYWNTPYVAEPFHDRNYPLFALLAGVRNYWDIEPIESPRGMPDDASDSWKAYVDKWNGDLHSHSWFTYDELKHVLQNLDGRIQFENGSIQSHVELFDTSLIDALAPLTSAADPGGAQIRFVFAFDN